MEAIIDGCAMDIDKTRYADLGRAAHSTAIAWPRRSGSCASRSSATRRRRRRRAQYAIDLGIALQLTNILRDVAEDARRGRIYLPAEDLRAFGVSDERIWSSGHALAGFHAPDAVPGGAGALALPARARRDLADERSQLVIAEIMGDIYYALLEEIEASQFDVFGRQARPCGAATRWHRARQLRQGALAPADRARA